MFHSDFSEMPPQRVTHECVVQWVRGVGLSPQPVEARVRIRSSDLCQPSWHGP